MLAEVVEDTAVGRTCLVWSMRSALWSHPPLDTGTPSSPAHQGRRVGGRPRIAKGKGEEERGGERRGGEERGGEGRGEEERGGVGRGGACIVTLLHISTYRNSLDLHFDHFH